MLDTLFKNCQVVMPYVGIVDGAIGVKDEKIACILSDASSAESKTVIDARGQHLMPGLVDGHTHFCIRRPRAEGYASESASAALGGVTTAIDYYRVARPEDSVEVDAEAVASRSFIDMGFHLNLHSMDTLQEIPALAAGGITSFKLLQGYAKEDAQQLGMAMIDDGFVYAALSRIAEVPGTLACVHCENADLVNLFRNRVRATGQNDLAAWALARPAIAEAENVLRLGYFAKVTGCPVLIVHLSSREGVKAVETLRSQGFRPFVETCPHYLTISVSEYSGFQGKVNPPIRFQEDIDALWIALEKGLIDVIGSDHVTHSKQDKCQDTIWSSLPGLPGSGTILPVLLSEGVNKGRLSLQRLAELACANPARLYGLPQKGNIVVGADADLVLVDLGLEKTVTAEALASSAGFTVYEGWRLKGWPTLTMLRGKVVARDGKIVASQPHGRFLKRLGSGRLD